MSSSSHEAAEFRLSTDEADTMIKWAIGFMVVLGVIGFLTGQAQGAATMAGIGMIGVVYVLIHRGRTHIDRSVHLRIDSFGITAPHVAHHTAPWSNIQYVKFWKPHRRPIHMCLKLVDDRAAGLKGLHALAAPFNNLLHGAIVVQVEDLEGEPEDISRIIQAFSPNTRVLHR